MRKGFTLLELVIVLIIIGVLATLAITQYNRMVERSRGAEARQIIGVIRTNQAAYRQDHNGVADVDAADQLAVGIGAAPDAPGPALANCRTSHYFWYAITAPASGVLSDSFTVRATRCGAGGKTPNGTGTLGFIELTSDVVTGVDSAWNISGY